MSITKATAALAALAALTPSAASGAADAVSLRDASVAPSYLRLLAPGQSTTKDRQCRGGYWSDVNAYRWTGDALAPQRWNSDRTVTRWGRVTFDGVTFRQRRPGRRPRGGLV